MDQISREIAYVPFSGRIRSKQDMLTNGHDKMRISVMILNLDMLPRGSMDLKFGHASKRSNGLKFGRASQRSNGLIFDVLPRGPLKLDLDMLSRGTMV